MGDTNHSEAAIWKHFTWGVFLDNNRINAEVSYIRNTLWDAKLLDRDWLATHEMREWENKTQEFVSNQLSYLQEGRKHAALEGLLGKLSDYSLTLKEAVAFFQRNSVSMDYLRKATRDEQATNKLLGDMTVTPKYTQNPQKIHGIGLTKAILWLHACGLAQDFCPPSRQIYNFIDQDLRNISYMQSKQQDNGDWYYIGMMRQFHNTEIKPSIPSATTRDTGVAIWYWKIGQGLLKRKREALNLQRFLDYLDAREIGLLKFASSVDNIDEVDDLARDVSIFVASA